MIALTTSLIEGFRYLYYVISAFVGIKSSMTKLKDLKSNKLRQKNLDCHKKIADVYPILQEALNSYEEIDRVSIFRSHNGDGIPQIGKQSFTTCIQEVLTYRTTPITERWQNIPNDQLMVEAITLMMTKGSANLPTYSDECPEGILADFCKGNNITNVIAVPIVYTNKGLIFLNFCSATCGDLESVDGILFEAKSCAGRVKELIEK